MSRLRHSFCLPYSYWNIILEALFTKQNPVTLCNFSSKLSRYAIVRQVAETVAERRAFSYFLQRFQPTFGNALRNKLHEYLQCSISARYVRCNFGWVRCSSYISPSHWRQLQIRQIACAIYIFFFHAVLFFSRLIYTCITLLPLSL